MLTASNTLTFVQIILSIARSQLGFSEIPKGSNWGTHVQKYLASVGINFATSWCMAFVYWTVDQAAKEMGIKNPLLKTGGVMHQWNEIDKRLKITKTATGWQKLDSSGKMVKTEIQPGDIGIMDFGKGLGHTFFVTDVAGDRVLTIEGNSNDDGSREGYEVCRKPNGRAIASVAGFIRLS